MKFNPEHEAHYSAAEVREFTLGREAKETVIYLKNTINSMFLQYVPERMRSHEKQLFGDEHLTGSNGKISDYLPPGIYVTEVHAAMNKDPKIWLNVINRYTRELIVSLIYAHQESSHHKLKEDKYMESIYMLAQLITLEYVSHDINENQSSNNKELKRIKAVIDTAIQNWEEEPHDDDSAEEIAKNLRQSLIPEADLPALLSYADYIYDSKTKSKEFQTAAELKEACIKYHHEQQTKRPDTIC